MRLTISHSTQYNYDSPVDYALQQVRLTPQDTTQQKVNSWQIDIEGGRSELVYNDQYDNHTMLVSMDPGSQSLKMTASGEVETLSATGILGQVYGKAPLWHFVQPSELTIPGNGIRKLARNIDKSDLLASLHALSAEICALVTYEAGKTWSTTSAEEALQGGHGVCQDHAQIFIAASRLAGIPARYIKRLSDDE